MVRRAMEVKGIRKLVVPAPKSHDVIAGRAALWNWEPWIVPEALEHLRKLVLAESRGLSFAFEWGAGGSTLWLSKRYDCVVSVERRPRWQAWVMERADKDKVTIYHAPIASGDMGMTEEYCHVILAYEDKTFDFISVDGEAEVRNECVKLAIPKLRGNGILLLDNSNWYNLSVFVGWEGYTYETEPFEFLSKIQVWATSIFVKPS